MDYIAIFFGLLPSFAWLMFYLEEDPHPEPKKLILETFLIGAASTFIVLAIQLQLNKLTIGNGIARYSLISFFILSSVEEIFKFGSARLVTWMNPKDFEESSDAMIYMIVAALGFAAVENIALALQPVGVNVFETVTLRFIGATLLHSVSSGLLGYYWALSLIRGKKRLLFGGIALATTLHAAFNYLILNYDPIVVPTILLTVAALFILHDFEKIKIKNLSQ